MLTYFIDCRYETDLPLQGSTLDCAMFLCGYASAMVGKRAMDFHQRSMRKFRAEMLQELQAIGIYFALCNKHFEMQHAHMNSPPLIFNTEVFMDRM